MDPRPSPAPEAHPRGEDSRRAILQAAIREFADHGEAGARTDAIARAAGVNKALLHYYFGSKDGLYGAVLDEVFRGKAERFVALLAGSGSPGERALRYLLAHFDDLAASDAHGRLLGQEMLRARQGSAHRIPRIVEVGFGPVSRAFAAVLAEGAAAGEFRAVDPGTVIHPLLGGNVFYFISAPFFREITGKDPRDPALLARQRGALLDAAATLLFADPEQGRALARRIHAQTEPIGGRP